VHGCDADTEAPGEAILTYAQERMRLHPVPLDGPKTPEQLQAVAGNTITTEGMGGLAALKLFGDELAPACLSNDHPRYLSLHPVRPH
jgi:L-2,4-diaminobutyrate decarboxylase